MAKRLPLNWVAIRSDLFLLVLSELGRAFCAADWHTVAITGMKEKNESTFVTFWRVTARVKIKVTESAVFMRGTKVILA